MQFRGLLVCGFAVSLGLVPAVWAQSNTMSTRLVALEQDVRFLQRELSRLRVDSEEIMRQNELLRKRLQEQTDAQTQQYVTLSQLNQSLQTLRTDLENQLRGQKKVVIDEVSAQVDQLAQQTQQAMQALARSVDARPSVAAPVEFGEYPKNGVAYTVQRGDTLSSIAQRHKSTVAYIKSANRLASDIIFPGQTLFVPQD